MPDDFRRPPSVIPAQDSNGPATVSVIVPLYGPAPPTLELLLTQLEAEDVQEVVVSVSGPHALPAMRSAQVLRSEQRLLPASAKNRGAYRATGSTLLFIDADNLIKPGLVHQLSSALHDPTICVVAAATHFQASPNLVAFFGATHRHWTGRTIFEPKPGTADVGPSAPRRPLMTMDVVANAYMIRRQTFETIGGFDEVTFPTHYEESDLIYRARDAHGGRVVCVPDAIVYNDMPLDVRRRLVAKDPLRSYYTGRNRPIFTARHLSERDWVVYLLAGQFLFTIAYAKAEILSSAGRDAAGWQSVLAYLAGVRDGYFCARRERRLHGIALGRPAHRAE